MFKTELTMTVAFDPKVKGARDAMYELAKRLKQNNFEVIKKMIKICLLLGGQQGLKWDDL